jgi:hypothetical protein
MQILRILRGTVAHVCNIPLGRDEEQGDLKSKTSLGYLARPSQENKDKKKQN